MKKTNIKTATFELDQFSDFLVEIEETATDYNAFLYHKEYAIKSLMFGMPKEQQSKKCFMQLVEYNAPDYISIYISEFMDE